MKIFSFKWRLIAWFHIFYFMRNQPTEKELAAISRLYEAEDVTAKDKLIHLRFFIGGSDWSEDRLIPDVIRAILAHKEIIIRTNDFRLKCLFSIFHNGKLNSVSTTETSY